jgi:hypothetical protein
MPGDGDDMYEILAIVLLNLAMVYGLSWRLHAVDSDLSTGQYFSKLVVAQTRLGTLLFGSHGDSELTRKPDGRPLIAAFTRCAGVTAGSTFVLILMVAARIMMQARG